MEIGVAAVGMVQCLCGHFCSNVSIPQQCRYIRKPQTTVEEFEEDKIELVSAREADLRVKLREENILHGMNPTAEVNLWLSNVQTMKAALASFKEESQKNKRWFCGCIPNYYHRLKLGNDVTRKMAQVDQLIEQSDFPENSLVNVQQPNTGEILQRTWSYLLDINTGIIGVYGMGGVGKTSIVKEINNKCLSDDNTRFDNVIWVTASRDSNQEKLQKDIAKEIGLSFDDQCNGMNMTNKLFEALQRRGRFVLIIDDLWEVFSLDNIGIPVPTIANGCKLLITTRSLNVCRGMETAVDIEVEVLSEAEAWDLFKRKVDEGVYCHPQVYEI